MKLSQLKDLFSNNIVIGVLRKSIEKEVIDYVTLLKKKGSSVPIYITEDATLKVSGSDIALLCKAYLDGGIEENHVYYIMDVLTLAEHVDFDNEELFDLVAGLTDPEINGDLTPEIAMQVINQIHLLNDE
ncbi:hypothetical protein ACFQZS_00055 [Mucilaginibacter calamicampi]|uniref:Uncharacterized protein n=1 Tax=Mucilaginibacter calamicampi TaxID=1302352 RepID=A0ABW2YTC1_9SPHI